MRVHIDFDKAPKNPWGSLRACSYQLFGKAEKTLRAVWSIPETDRKNPLFFVLFAGERSFSSGERYKKRGDLSG